MSDAVRAQIAQIMRDKAAGRVNAMGDYWADHWCGDAADEIERLEALNLRLAKDAMTDRDEVARLRAALEPCADELEAEIKDRYGLLNTSFKDVHPAIAHKYERDMATVYIAREVLSDE